MMVKQREVTSAMLSPGEYGSGEHALGMTTRNTTQAKEDMKT
jgi:hypothetical protein